MKKNTIIVSKMNCSYLVKRLSDELNEGFCDLMQEILNVVDNVDTFKKQNGEDKYLKLEKDYLTNLLKEENKISFVAYDIFKHNIDSKMYTDTYVIMLDFGYFILRSNEMVRMQQSARYLRAKGICDEIINCINKSEDNIIKDLKRGIYESRKK